MSDTSVGNGWSRYVLAYVRSSARIAKSSIARFLQNVAPTPTVLGLLKRLCNVGPCYPHGIGLMRLALQSVKDRAQLKSTFSRVDGIASWGYIGPTLEGEIAGLFHMQGDQLIAIWIPPNGSEEDCSVWLKNIDAKHPSIFHLLRNLAIAIESH